MTTHIPFLCVQVTAVFCYLIFLVAFVAVKKDKVINSFIASLLTYLVWTGGSLLMRLQVFPGIDFWFVVSLMGLFSIAYVLFIFVCEITEIKAPMMKIMHGIGTVVILFFTAFQMFLKAPVLVDRGDGTSIFVYDMPWQIAIPSVYIMIQLLCCAWIAIKAARERGLATPWITPILLGVFVQFFGNIISILPNMVFPIDTMTSIFNTFCIFYALYKKRLFKMKLLVSKRLIFVFALIMTTILFSYTFNSMTKSVSAFLPQFASSAPLIVAVLYVGVTFFVSKIIQLLTDAIFIKEEQLQSQRLKEFSLNAAKSLNQDEIMSDIIKVIQPGIGVNRVYICVKDEKGDFIPSYSSRPLDSLNFRISATNPFVERFRKQDDSIMLKEFQRSPMYKGMWDDEKKLMTSLNICYMVPLKKDDEIVGIILLAEKQKNSDYNFDDVTFLDSVKSIAAIALSNAYLYEKTLYEARMDMLTGLCNRKYFNEQLNEVFEKCRLQNESLSLLIVNLDDFKLYNQLYGNHEGDIVLKKVAGTITSLIGKHGVAGRYGGKEFSILMPGYDAHRTLNLANNLKEQISQINRGSSNETMKLITFSGGICVYPYGASTVKQLVYNADMSVYNAKRSGKNKILVYTYEIHDNAVHTVSEVDEESVRSGKYSEYASTIYALTAAIDAKDHYTFSHSQKVAKYATALASAAGLNEDHVNIIYESALLHDIGKISIPESILSKTSRLTNEEYEIMKKHVENSIAIIRHLPSLDYVIPSVVGHHERWDGKGYPRGLKGEDIPISARCLAIADSFDAMTSVRAYKEAYSVDYALQEIEKNEGLQFDPKLAALFVKITRENKIAVTK